MIDEQLSVFLDEESDTVEIRRSIRALQNDAQYRQSWQRQLLIREVLHSDDAIPPMDEGFADRVTAALNAGEAGPDNVVPLQRRTRSSRWWQGAAGLATAASVAAAVVLVVQPFSPIDATGSVERTTVASAASMDGESATQGSSRVARVANRVHMDRGMATNHWTVSDPAVAEQLNNYLLEHNGLATSYGMSGARPSFVRVATYGWHRDR